MLAEGEGGAAVMATMLRAAIALERDDPEAAAASCMTRSPPMTTSRAEMRDIATIRSVAARYDEMEPQAVIDRVGPLAVPDNSYYGSAGELVAHAYLDQGKRAEAGALLADIAGNDEVPSSLRAACASSWRACWASMRSRMSTPRSPN